MRALLPAVVVITALTSIASAGPREDALGVIERWDKAFAASDVAGVIGLYAPDATFFGTGSKTTVTTAAGIRSYFENALRNTKWQTAPLKDAAVTVLSDDTVVVTGLDELSGVRNEQKVGGVGRVTFAVTKRGADWQIVHFHRSAVPK